MSVGRLRQIGISIALGSCLALGCGREKSEQPAAGAAAPVPGVNPAALPDFGNHEELPDFDTLPTVELPRNFPEDVPLYPGVRAVKVTPDTESEGGWVAQFSTPDDPAKISANLSDAFAAQGWSTDRADSPDGILLHAHKGNRSVTYALGPDKGKTIVSLIIQGKS